MAEIFGPEKTKVVNKNLPDLNCTLSECQAGNLLDGFGMYLYGVVLKVVFCIVLTSRISALIEI